MSIAAITWALTAAPVESAQEHVILIALADRARDDGTAAWPSQAWLAGRARCSTRTVRRHLRALEDRGIIRRGDQDLVAHLRSDSRPIVWDLNLDQIVDTVAGPDVLPIAIPDHVPERSRVSARSTEAARPDTVVRSGRTLPSDKPSLDSSGEPSTTPPATVTSMQRAPRRSGVVVSAHAEGRFDTLAAACRERGLSARWDALKPDQVDAIASLLEQHGVDALADAAHAAHRPSNPTRYAQGLIGAWSAMPTRRRAAAPRPACGECVNGWVEDPVTRELDRRCSCRTTTAAVAA